MPKSYVIARITVHDEEAYKAYIPVATAAMQRFGGRPLARGGRMETLEGEGRKRNVVIAFESFEQARAFYHSPDYQEAVALRAPVAEADVVVVEGLD